jgi:hypothetical protein
LYQSHLQAEAHQEVPYSHKAIHGNRHDYLAMILDFSIPGVLQVDMTPYIKSMIEEFPDKLSGKTKTPWNENLFKVDPNSKHLETEQAKVLHTFVMKGMFLCKRGHQDIQPAIAFMATRVTEPNEGDWKKLVKMMNYLKATDHDVPCMSANDTVTIKWHVNAAFAIHKDMESHTGATRVRLPMLPMLPRPLDLTLGCPEFISTHLQLPMLMVNLTMIHMKMMWIPPPSQVSVAPRHQFAATSDACQNLLPVMMMRRRALKASSSTTFQSRLSPFHRKNVELL